MPLISLIAAMTPKRVIAKDGQMPWHCPADLAYFKAMTLGKPVIMGRKTRESLSAPLPHRTNIVLSRRSSPFPGEVCCQDLQSAIDAVSDCPEIMIIGGGQVYQQALGMADYLYLSIIHCDSPGDVYFPQWPEDEWALVSIRHCPQDESNPACDFTVYRRVAAV